jgi:two-component sensor histidine kinase
VSVRKNLALLLGLALVPATVLLGYNVVESRLRERDRLLADAQHQARYLAARLDATIQGSRSLTWALSDEAPAMNADPERCTDMLRAVIGSATLYRSASMTDRYGKVMCSWPSPGRAMFLSRDEYVRDALEQPDMVIGTLLIRDRLTGNPVLPLARRYSLGPDVRGVIVLGLDLEQLARHFRAQDTRSDRTVSILDRAGTVVLRLPETSGALGEKMSSDLIRLTHRAEAGTLPFRDAAGHRALAGYAKTGDMTVVVGLDPERVADQLNGITIRHGLVAVLVVLAAAAAAWAVGERRIQQPLRALADAARRQERGESQARAPAVSASPELDVLARNFNRLTESNEQISSQRDTLLRELQHRVTSSFQMLASFLHLQSRNADPIMREPLEAARERVLSMSRTFRYLYRADLASTVDFGTFLEAFARDTARAYLGFHAPKLEVKADPLQLPIESALSLALVLHELVTNAVKHAYPPGKPGKIMVRFRVLADGSSELSVTDFGVGMPLDFDLDKTKTLGLVLVQRMAQSLHSRMQIRSRQGETLVTLALPRRSGVRR